MLYCIVFLGVIEKSGQKLVLRVSPEVLNTEKQMFGTPDETLALVFDILHPDLETGILLLINLKH